jgi:alpha-mannosidase
VIVRLYEAHGGRAHARLRAAFPVAAVTETDLLERPLPTARALIGDRATDEAVLELRPFQIVTLRLRPTGGGQVRL